MFEPLLGRFFSGDLGHGPSPGRASASSSVEWGSLPYLLCLFPELS